MLDDELDGLILAAVVVLLKRKGLEDTPEDAELHRKAVEILKERGVTPAEVVTQFLNKEIS
jgi:hypothetical protein